MHNSLLLFSSEGPGWGHCHIHEVFPLLVFAVLLEEAGLPFYGFTCVINDLVVVARVLADVELRKDEGVYSLVTLITDEAESLQGGCSQEDLLFYITESFIIEYKLGAQGGDLRGSIFKGDLNGFSAAKIHSVWEDSDVFTSNYFHCCFSPLLSFVGHLKDLSDRFAQIYIPEVDDLWNMQNAFWDIGPQRKLLLEVLADDSEVSFIYILVFEVRVKYHCHPHCESWCQWIDLLFIPDRKIGGEWYEKPYFARLSCDIANCYVDFISLVKEDISEGDLIWEDLSKLVNLLPISTCCSEEVCCSCPRGPELVCRASIKLSFYPLKSKIHL